MVPELLDDAPEDEPDEDELDDEVDDELLEEELFDDVLLEELDELPLSPPPPQPASTNRALVKKIIRINKDIYSQPVSK